MHRRKFSTRPHAAPKRRKWEWSHLVYNQQTAKAADSFDALLSYRTELGIMANLPDQTIIRIRGYMVFQIPSATAPTTAMGAIVGGYVDTKNLAAVSVPTTAPFIDWCLYQPVHVPNEGFVPGSTGIGFGADIDSHAMRKLHNVDDTFWISWGSLDGTLLKASGNFSIGLKLP